MTRSRWYRSNLRDWLYTHNKPGARLRARRVFAGRGADVDGVRLWLCALDGGFVVEMNIAWGELQQPHYMRQSWRSVMAKRIGAMRLAIRARRERAGVF